MKGYTKYALMTVLLGVIAIGAAWLVGSKLGIGLALLSLTMVAFGAVHSFHIESKDADVEGHRRHLRAASSFQHLFLLAAYLYLSAATIITAFMR